MVWSFGFVVFGSAFQIVAKASVKATIFNAEKMRKGLIAEGFSVESAISVSLR